MIVQLVTITIGVVALSGDFAWKGVIVAACSLVFGLAFTRWWLQKEHRLLGPSAPPPPLGCPDWPERSWASSRSACSESASPTVEGSALHHLQADAGAAPVVGSLGDGAADGRLRLRHRWSARHDARRRAVEDRQNSRPRPRTRGPAQRHPATGAVSALVRRRRRPAADHRAPLVARSSNCSRSAAPTPSRNAWRGSSTATGPSSRSVGREGRWPRSARHASTCRTRRGTVRSRTGCEARADRARSR